MIETDDLGFAVGRTWLLRGVKISLRPGRLAVIIGPNGAGKSTLLRLLTGELTPTSGGVTVAGRDMRSIPPAELSRVRAVVPQHTLLAFPFTVIEVVELGVTVPGLMTHGPHSKRMAEAMLDRVGLLPLADRAYPNLSGGERQRVHIARALCQLAATGKRERPFALLVDEPTSSLDIAHQLTVLQELKSQAADGRVVVAVLHDLNLSAAYADDVLLLSEGRQLAFGEPDTVLADPLLSKAYGCRIRLNALPDSGGQFVLPQSCGIG